MSVKPLLDAFDVADNGGGKQQQGRQEPVEPGLHPLALSMIAKRADNGSRNARIDGDALRPGPYALHGQIVRQHGTFR